MLRGELYDASDPELALARRQTRELLHRISAAPADEALLRPLYAQLFGAIGESIGIEPPFYCDYGQHIRLGDRVFFNCNCVVLDPAEVTIGSDTLFGPAVQIYTATHPLDYLTRRKRLEAAKPISIGCDVWVGGGAIICPGISIGDGSIIGAGSIVTRDVPPGVVAAGNPCRIIRALEEKR